MESLITRKKQLTVFHCGTLLQWSSHSMACPIHALSATISSRGISPSMSLDIQAQKVPPATPNASQSSQIRSKHPSDIRQRADACACIRSSVIEPLAHTGLMSSLRGAAFNACTRLATPTSAHLRGELPILPLPPLKVTPLLPKQPSHSSLPTTYRTTGATLRQVASRFSSSCCSMSSSASE